LLETGSPTWLYVSDRLIQFPMGIFAIAIGTVLLPTLSKLDLKNEKIKFIQSVHKGQRFVIFIAVPSLVGLFFCAEDLISTIFYRGAFTQIDVLNTSYSLMAFSFGLPFFMLMKVLTPAFFARKDTKTPMYVAIVSLILNASLNYYLAFILNFGHIGIALGSSIAALISVLILEFVLYKDGFIKIKNIFNRFNIMILCSSLSLILFLIFYTNLTNFMDFSQVERFLYLSIEVIISIIIYGAVSRLILRKPIQTLFE
jgi:putative peptidoglycan lipid II flippase